MLAAIRNASFTSASLSSIARHSSPLATTSLRIGAKSTVHLVTSSFLPSRRPFSQNTATFSLASTLASTNNYDPDPAKSSSETPESSGNAQHDPQQYDESDPLELSDQDAESTQDQEPNQSPDPLNSKPKPVKDHTFASLKGHISYSTWKALTNKPFLFKEMSVVQQRVLHLLPELGSAVGRDAQPMPDGEGRDMLVKARTGTGKTIAFLVPAIEARIQAQADVMRSIYPKPWADMLKRHRPDLDVNQLDKHGRLSVLRQFNQNTVGALIISPTRELATQIANEAKKLLTYHDGLEVQLIVGGASRQHQVNDWRRGRPDIVVATPGRLLDLIREVGMIREALSATRSFILDEADTLLEMGFREDIYDILKVLPPKSERHNMLFSATVSSQIKAVAQQSLEPDHRLIDCVPPGEENAHKHIPQYSTVIDRNEKLLPHLIRLISHDQLINPGKSKVIVFANTTNMTRFINQFLIQARSELPAEKGTRVYEIHSQKDQRSRFHASDRFRDDKCGATVLVTSDVSARGVDYPGTTRVIQIGIPSSKDQYIHRIGRTGRAGASGRADIILQDFEERFLRELSDMTVNPISTDDMTEEVEKLASQFDQSPRDFQPDGKPQGSDPFAFKRRQNERQAFSRIYGPLSHRYTDDSLIPKSRNVVQNLEDRTLVDSAFLSSVGFYCGSSAEMLGLTKVAIVDGLKRWSMEVGCLLEPPYLSPRLLQNLGIRQPGVHGSVGGGRGFGRDYGRQDRRGSTRDRRGEEWRGQSYRESGSSQYNNSDRGGDRYGQDRRSHFNGGDDDAGPFGRF